MVNPNTNRTYAVIIPADSTKNEQGLRAALVGLAATTQTLVEEERESLFSLAKENLVFCPGCICPGQYPGGQFSGTDAGGGKLYGQ